MRHLLAVWNPSYEADALQQHVTVLLERMRQLREGQCAEDDVFVWWGKVRSSNRQAPLPHLADVLALDDALRADETLELSLYLTDYRSLYVAHLDEVTDDDILAKGEPNVPAYYRQHDLKCDCWFRILDVRRLVHDDTPAVTEELKKLRNTRYNDRPVSLYGGMVDLPLLVTRPDEVTWFDATLRQRFIGEQYWAQYDAERAGAAAMQRELRENRFGTAAWEALDPAVRGFLASAESVVRQHRADTTFKLNNVVVDLGNALEVQVNHVLRQAMRTAADPLRVANVDGTRVDLGRNGMLTLVQLARVIGEDAERNAFLKRAFARGGEWFTASLPAILRDVGELRNAAAHGNAVDRDRALALRDRLVGVGSLGVLLELAQVRVR